MGKLEISRHVGQGDMVIRRGNKIQRKRVKGGLPLYGVWEDGHDRVTISSDDKHIVTPQPRGVVQRGTIEVKAKVEGT